MQNSTFENKNSNNNSIQEEEEDSGESFVNPRKHLERKAKDEAKLRIREVTEYEAEDGASHVRNDDVRMTGSASVAVGSKGLNENPNEEIPQIKTLTVKEDLRETGMLDIVEVHCMLGSAIFLGRGAAAIAYKVNYRGQVAVFKKAHRFEYVMSFMHEFEMMKQMDGAGGVPRCLGLSLVPLGILMELCEGRPFCDFILSDFPMNRLLEALPEIARALHDVHLKGFIHVDFKNDNIIVDMSAEDDNPPKARIIDVGLAAPEGKIVRLPIATDNTFYAPEYRMGCSASPTGDVYSFGFMMKVMLHYRSVVVPLKFWEITYRALAPQPSDRPSVPELIKDLDEAVQEIKGWRALGIKGLIE